MVVKTVPIMIPRFTIESGMREVGKGEQSQRTRNNFRIPVLDRPEIGPQIK